jgi:hypothetical protein
MNSYQALKFIEKGYTLKDATKHLGVGYTTLARFIISNPQEAEGVLKHLLVVATFALLVFTTGVFVWLLAKFLRLCLVAYKVFEAEIEFFLSFSFFSFFIIGDFRNAIAQSFEGPILRTTP